MGIRDEDLASTLAELEDRLSRSEVATALGVDEGELDKIASGYLPEPAVADRLRALAADGGAPRPVTSRLSRRVIVAFVVSDLLFFGMVAFFVLAR